MDSDKVLFYPAEIGAETLRMLEERKASPHGGQTTGITLVDAVLKPMRPSELITIIGRPSNYKTGLMQYILRHATNQLITEQANGVPGADKEYVLYVTWEVSIQESGGLDIANETGLDIGDLASGKFTDDEWGRVRGAALRRGGKPLWIMGHSINHRRSGALTMGRILETLTRTEDEMGMKPRLIALDYLQRIPAARPADRRIYVSENVDLAKDLALIMGCPVMLGCQAKREVDDRDFAMPGLPDGMETSNIEHASDKILGVWYPKTSRYGEMIEHGINMIADDSLLLISVAKQRFGKAGVVVPVAIDPGTNSIDHGKVVYALKGGVAL